MSQRKPALIEHEVGQDDVPVRGGKTGDEEGVQHSLARRFHHSHLLHQAGQRPAEAQPVLPQTRHGQSVLGLLPPLQVTELPARVVQVQIHQGEVRMGCQLGQLVLVELGTETLLLQRFWMTKLFLVST